MIFILDKFYEKKFNFEGVKIDDLSMFVGDIINLVHDEKLTKIKCQILVHGEHENN